jgi:CxxC motif-containing protein (DUF1111 family)
MRLATVLLLVLGTAACATQPPLLRNFIRPPIALDARDAATFGAGRELFAKRWTEAEGLGPLFDGQSCLICHPRGGHGRPVEAGRTPAQNASMIVRLVSGDGAYGQQLQRRRSGDGAGEGAFTVVWTETGFTFPDGETVLLRAPRYSFTGLAHGDLPEGFSVVVAPKVAGTGLLEAVSEADVRAGTDPEDRNRDGISGRASLTRDGLLGRFGWRGEAATIPQQVARAFALDMSLSTSLYPDPDGDCTAGPCRSRFGASSSSRVEVSERQFADLAAFVRMIEPPPQAARNSAAKRGASLFSALGCASCHRPAFATGLGRTISPYTDLLLHEMGERLADGAGGEWRTAPLWGVTRRLQVHGEAFYLHDGRARSLTEAILWHGGEAERARSAFVDLPRAQRRVLLAFLETI